MHSTIMTFIPLFTLFIYYCFSNVVHFSKLSEVSLVYSFYCSLGKWPGPNWSLQMHSIFSKLIMSITFSLNPSNSEERLEIK